MLITRKLIEAVKGFEGCKLEAYKCPAGVWTIGYGHTKGVTRGMKISQATADKWLAMDLESCAQEVLSVTKGVSLTQGMLDALTDFVFNLGVTKLKQSTLLRILKAGAPRTEVAAEFGKWVYAGKTKLTGLVKRREWEAERFLE